ncbi:MAG: hypothetical protein ACXVH3_38840 [Solirubrobacteraceae bacterium]
MVVARDTSQQRSATVARGDDRSASWRERALNTEALAKSLRLTVKERDARISDLLGQLYDPTGHHLADELRLRELTGTLSRQLRSAEVEISKLQRSLDASRATVKREQERNVTQLFPQVAKQPPATSVPHGSHVGSAGGEQIEDD